MTSEPSEDVLLLPQDPDEGNDGDDEKEALRPSPDVSGVEALLLPPQDLTVVAAGETGGDKALSLFAFLLGCSLSQGSMQAVYWSKEKTIVTG